MNKLITKIYYNLRYRKEKYPEHPIRVYRKLMKSQFWTYDKIERYQLNRLNNLLIIAKNGSDYYKKVLKDIDLQIKSLSDFIVLIPALTKEMIKSNKIGLKLSYLDIRRSLDEK